MADKKYGPLEQCVGNVGGDPVEATTRVGPVVRFSVARTMGYGDDAPPPRWVNVSVFNEELRAKVMATIKKGTPVALEGNIKSDTYNGKPQFNMNALRVGVVQWFTKSKSSKPAASTEVDDELGW